MIRLLNRQLMGLPLDPDEVYEVLAPMDAVIVGDLDSLNPDAYKWADALDIPIERHNKDKDETDGELALTKALSLGATSILILPAGLTGATPGTAAAGAGGQGGAAGASGARPSGTPSASSPTAVATGTPQR